MDILKEHRQNGIYAKHAVTERPDDRDFLMHLHGSAEIYFFVDGKTDYIVEGTVYTLRRGDVLLIRPSESHKPRITAGVRYERYNVNFRESLISSVDPEGRLLRPFFDRSLGKGNLYRASELGDLPLERMFYELCHTEDDDYGIRLRLLSFLLRVLERIGEAYDKRGAADYDEGDRLSEIVDKTHFYDLVHIKLRKFVGAEKRHNGASVRVLCDGLLSSRRGPRMACVAFELFNYS